MKKIKELKQEIAVARKKLREIEKEINATVIKETRNYYATNKQDIYESFVLGFPYLTRKELKECNYDGYTQSRPFYIFQYGFRLGTYHLTKNDCYFGTKIQNIVADLAVTHELCRNAISQHVGRIVTRSDVETYINDGAWTCGIVPSWEFLLKVAGNQEIQYDEEEFEIKCSEVLARCAENLLLK
jgi:hypothetical protein